MPADGQTDPKLAKAFHDLHGSRLHGFALLVTLGDAARAEQAAGEALAASDELAPALRHPERAAAWLRSRALRTLRHAPRDAAVSDESRRAALAKLGVDATTYLGLSALSVEARAALVASAIERFETIDVEAILGAGPSPTRHAISAARAGYLAAIAASPDGQAAPSDRESGPLATRVGEVASRAMTSQLAQP